MFKDHFSSVSKGYAAYRPGYPDRLVEVLAEVSPGRDLALDCGCGTGQLSVLLASRFEAVVATDASAAQIQQAERHNRVTYRTALAEESGLPEGSVDLITVAQAAHWFDLPKFYEEVRRVARPGAALALITYGVLHVEGDVDAAVQHFYYDVVGPYWPFERRLVENGYRDLPFPFEERPVPTLAMESWWDLKDLLGYVGTWSAVKEAEKSLGTNPVLEFEERLRQEWGDPTTRRRVTWPLSLRIGNV
ncbi:class I SAM-dependent methyltransferase [bacterium]|nr:MAG: class I SAM-dependent methyltransferase [bacterium]